MLVSLQEPAQTQARMHHKHKYARNRNPLLGGSLEGCGCSCREFLEVASFVPGHVQNRGATPRSWTALCSKKNKVATPLGTDPMERQHSGAQTGANAAADQTRCTLRFVHPSRLMEPMSCRSGACRLGALRQAPPRPVELSFCTRTCAAMGTPLLGCTVASPGLLHQPE